MVIIVLRYTIMDKVIGTTRSWLSESITTINYIQCSNYSATETWMKWLVQSSFEFQSQLLLPNRYSALNSEQQNHVWSNWYNLFLTGSVNHNPSSNSIPCFYYSAISSLMKKFKPSLDWKYKSQSRLPSVGAKRKQAYWAKL